MNIWDWVLMMVVMFTHFQAVKYYMDRQMAKRIKTLNQLEGSMERKFFAAEEQVRKLRDQLVAYNLEITRTLDKHKDSL